MLGDRERAQQRVQVSFIIVSLEGKRVVHVSKGRAHRLSLAVAVGEMYKSWM